MPITAFYDMNRLASGGFDDVTKACQNFLGRNAEARLLIFDDSTGEVVEVGVSRLAAGRSEEVEAEGPRGPGRPKLGVVAREVTLLPRHWEWLAGQPGGASVALRKLVEQAIRSNRDADTVRRAQGAAYRFMTAIAGDEAGYEEAIRALFAGSAVGFARSTEQWPADVRAYAKKLAASAFPDDREPLGAEPVR